MSYLLYLLYRILSEAVALLPLTAGFTLGRALGWIAYYLAAPYRRLVLRNLAIAFKGEKSPREMRRLAREHFATLGANLLSSFKLATMSPEGISARVEIVNMQALHLAAEPGKGVLLMLSHLGNWELLAQLVPHGPPGRRVGTVYQPLGNRHFDQHVKAARARFGLVAFDRRRGFREPITFLRSGNVACVLVDQHAGDGGIWTPLFGRLASTSPLAATMVLHTGAPLIAVAVYTIGHARWRLVLSDPLPRDTSDPGQLTAEINLALEKEICVSPADWFWVHNRWKTPRPEFLLAHYKRGVSLPPGFPPSGLKPFEILIRSANWLGDAVMSVPAVRAIKAGRPDARVTVLTLARLADFWKTVPEVDEVVPILPGEGLLAVARKIKRRFEVAFVFPNSVRSGLEVFLGGIPRRIGYRRPWRGRAINAVVPDPRPGPMVHEVHHYLAMARYAGAEVPDLLSLKPWEAHRANAASGAPLLLGLVPGAEYGSAKRWLPDRFAAVARQIREQTGAQWRIFGMASDRPAADEIAAALEGQCENLAGQTTLAQFIECLRECRLLLTNDTGAMHLAAHLGVPVLAIFGSTENRLTGPLRGRVLRHHAACSPCFLRECPLDFRCMKSVTAEEVTAAVLEELASHP